MLRKSLVEAGSSNDVAHVVADSTAYDFSPLAPFS